MTTSLILNDVTKSFGYTRVLEGITLAITPGETVAIMGPSGSGKSTLLHCMSGILQPTSGQVLFNGSDLGGAKDSVRSDIRRKHLGFVFQQSQLLPELTALDNIALPAVLNGDSRAHALKMAEGLLDQLGLGAIADARPGNLSGGQAQRVAIARALITSPAIIFADEPTGALDQSTGQEIMQLLTTIASRQGSSLVVVTHDPNVASWLNRRIEIRDGIIHDDRVLRGA